METQTPQPHKNVYRNVIANATPNPLMPTPDVIDEAFVEASNHILVQAAELARLVIGAHQSAIAIVINQDWNYVRKYFSLSEKYASWATYDTPAKGFGTHAWFLRHNQPIRLTQAELEAHPEWLNFGTESSVHPPMRGWMAAPLIDRQGTNWGLFQLSDRYEGDFTEDDEAHFIMLAQLVSSALEALWDVRNLQKQLQQNS